VGEDREESDEVTNSRTEREVAPALRALLEGVWDFAGLFPPARLGMADAVSNYASYLAGEHAWMLGRIVVPAARLDEFEAAASGLLPRNEGDEPWQLSGLIAPAGDEGLPADVERIEAFNETHAEASNGLAAIQVVELRTAEADDIDDTLDLIPETVVPFFEIPVDGDPRGLIAALAGTSAGAKVRCGGADPAAIPDPAVLARFIETCTAADVTFKATAGLHHPLRHRSDEIGGDEFGFLNLLVAAALSRVLRVEEPLLIEALEEREPGAFVFDAQELRWRDQLVSVDQIGAARLGYAAAIGSCSFTEPIDHLRTLGLL
jgi:hypothetical protein